MDRTVKNWHSAIIKDCEHILGRALHAPELRFITSRGGFVALEMIHDYVKGLAGKPEELSRHLNSEAVEEARSK